MKETYYFSHDYNARNDRKMVKLCFKEGMEGVGIFWCIIEMLYEEGGYIEKDEYECIADELRSDKEKVKNVVENYKLFKFSMDKFYSESVLARLRQRKGKSEKARQSAIVRWDKHKDKNANAMRTQCDGNAIKERKGKERKVNTYTPFLEKFNTATKRQFKILDDKTKRQLSARLKEGFTEDDILKATGNAYKDEYHQKTSHQYLTPEFITRADKLQRFLNVKKPEWSGSYM